MNTKLIKQKIKSVGNIKKITRTMEMVSVAKMKRTTDAANAYRSFIANALGILHNVHTDSYLRHPFIKKDIPSSLLHQGKVPQAEGVHDTKNILIIIGANKGLCGGYNTQLYKAVSKYFSDKNDNVSVIAIGKYAEKIAKKFTNDIFLSYIKNNISIRDATIVTKEIIKRYMDKENPINTVTIINPHITTGVSYTIKTLQVLPFNINVDNLDKNSKDKSTEIKTTSLAYTYEPSPESVIESIIPLIIESIVLSSARETEAGEHTARMMAMKTATDNAGDLLDDLKLTYNNARQAKITQEIAEISSAMV